MAVKDFMSPTQFDFDETGIESPPRPTMQPGEHLNAEQFQGLTGSPEALKARSPYYIDGRSVHEWRTKVAGTNRDENTKESD
jgi:hypothetical protein